MAAFGAAAVLNTGCAFERSTEVLGPTTVSGPTTTAPTAAPTASSIVGLWVSNTLPVNAVPDPSTCGNFQFQITNQTSNSITGTFSGTCGGGLSISAAVAGQLNGNAVRVDLTGAATGLPGIPSCAFTLTANGNVENNGYALPLSYTGTTCLGPVRGTETLRRPQPAAPAPPPPPPAPEPKPEPPAPPAESQHHVGPGPLSEARANQVVDATAREFPHLTAVFGSESEAVAAADELLLRTIWHLQHAGYQAGRQRNPSGAISSDKLTIFINGGWHVYDVYSLGTAGRATRVIFLEVPLPNHVPDSGIPD